MQAALRRTPLGCASLPPLPPAQLGVRVMCQEHCGPHSEQCHRPAQWLCSGSQGSPSSTQAPGRSVSSGGPEGSGISKVTGSLEQARPSPRACLLASRSGQPGKGAAGGEAERSPQGARQGGDGVADQVRRAGGQQEPMGQWVSPCRPQAPCLVHTLRRGSPQPRHCRLPPCV